MLLYKSIEVNIERLSRAKASFTTRRVPLERASVLLTDGIVPQAGDLVLALVNRIGQHRRLELANGRKSELFVGDEIIVSYGNRYAPDQFEAIVPGDLSPCHLAAGGGVAARVLSRHDKMKNPTAITPLGILADAQGEPLNLSAFGIKRAHGIFPQPITFAVAGTSMNAGKTTTAAYFIRGLSESGLRVGAAKITGTGSGADTWLMLDAGAKTVLDFVDAGFVTTYRVPVERTVEIMLTLIGHLSETGVDAIVLEVADGLYQEETARLLSHTAFREYVHGMIFASSDAMGCSAGVEWLRQRGIHALALSGVFTASPLAVCEAQLATGLPVLSRKNLADPDIATILRNQLENKVIEQPIVMGSICPSYM